MVIEYDKSISSSVAQKQILIPDDDAQLFYSVEEEVEEISKALELPDLDAEDYD